MNLANSISSVIKDLKTLTSTGTFLKTQENFLNFISKTRIYIAFMPLLYLFAVFYLFSASSQIFKMYKNFELYGLKYKKQKIVLFLHISYFFCACWGFSMHIYDLVIYDFKLNSLSSLYFTFAAIVISSISFYYQDILEIDPYAYCAEAFFCLFLLTFLITFGSPFSYPNILFFPSLLIFLLVLRVYGILYDPIDRNLTGEAIFERHRAKKNSASEAQRLKHLEEVHQVVIDWNSY